MSDFNKPEIGYDKICLIKSTGQREINILIEKYKDRIPKNKTLGKLTIHVHIELTICRMYS